MQIRTESFNRNAKIYLSGPMTGLPDYNKDAFKLRAEILRNKGFHVNNPAEISDKHGLDKPYGFYLRKALQQLLDSDVVYVFGDITNSKGAQMEIKIAQTIGMPVYWGVCFEVYEI